MDENEVLKLTELLSNLSVDEAKEYEEKDIKDLAPSMDNIWIKRAYKRYILPKKVAAKTPFKRLIVDKDDLINALENMSINSLKIISNEDILAVCDSSIISFDDISQIYAILVLRKCKVLESQASKSMPLTFVITTYHEPEVSKVDYIKDIERLMCQKVVDICGHFYVDKIRRDLISLICERLFTWCSGMQITNREHLLVAGIRGVGKTTFFKNLLYCVQEYGLPKINDLPYELHMVYIVADDLIRSQLSIVEYVASTIRNFIGVSFIAWLEEKGTRHVLIVLDEAQSILRTPEKIDSRDKNIFRSWKAEISQLSNYSNLTLIITGSGYSLTEVAYHGEFISLNNNKLHAYSYSPICFSQKEYNEVRQVVLGPKVECPSETEVS